MRLLNRHEGCEKLITIGFPLADVVRKDKFPNRVTYRIPIDSRGMTALARVVATVCFAGRAVLFEVSERGIWPSSENPYLFQQYRASITDNGDIDGFPCHVIDTNEVAALEGLLALSLYFHWGVEIASLNGDLLFITSHDDWCEIIGPSPGSIKVAVEVLDDLGLERR